MIKKIISIVKHKWWIVIVAIIVIVIFVWLNYVRVNCGLWNEKDCTGFAGKSIWNVLELVGVPFTLVVIAFILDSRDRKADRENTIDIQRETILQNYFDAMTRLILDKNLRNSNPNDEVRQIAQVKTISTLERLNTDRKNKLLSFLCDLSLVNANVGNQPIINLNGINFENGDLWSANLNCAELINSHLEFANLAYAQLEGADLTCAHFDGADLLFARLLSANLFLADLTGAFLVNAQLKGADLSGSDLEEANLEGANLEGANLDQANLLGANLIGANLEGAIFHLTTMPDGKEYDPDIHTTEKLTIKISG
jgi:uncharacterized protein YjbI with pentapeptide repeats